MNHAHEGGINVFPQNNNFTGINRPGRFEGVIDHLEVRGTLPEQLSGILYRCGPDPAFAPKLGDDIYINGDGMVSMFDIRDGRVTLRSRYVETDKLMAERKAGRGLFGAYRNPYSDDASVVGVDRSTANTAVIWHNHRLFALKEDGLPYEVDPLTLETIGKVAFEGLRSNTMTAHPKVDPVTGDWVYFGYNAGGEFETNITVGSVCKQGKLKSENWFVPPYQSLIHDWAVTQNHTVVPIMPLAGDEERAKQGKPRWAWDQDLPSYLAVNARDSADEPALYPMPALWSFHTLNSFEEDDLLHIDLCVSEIAPMPDKFGNAADRTKTAQYLTRWTVDLSRPGSEVVQRRLLDGIHVDFPEIDQRYQTLPYRHGFLAGRDTTKPVNDEIAVGVWFNTLIHIDLETGETETWYSGDNSNVQEPVFVPRSVDAEEGDGFLLTLINRFPEGLTEVVVLDTARFAEGPIATIYAPIHIRPTFHGLWVPEADLHHLDGRGATA